ncbi:CLUMA_CG014753, isoform A [Clunio marinus]|uniref:CLUMA_CG014753, isoform A n=1 Tax=Clunio marinus TaxID=568069 RepID=A0A1J1IQA6_9DIPT|nr:CLUMA_CG014753, isoform A [Clunio marinus]
MQPLLPTSTMYVIMKSIPINANEDLFHSSFLTLLITLMYVAMIKRQNILFPSSMSAKFIGNQMSFEKKIINTKETKNQISQNCLPSKL